jgi:glycosyltransferase involved in cell wall biosynthesis
MTGNKTYLILTLVPYPYGGEESFMYQTIPWLQEKGFRCVWVSFNRNTSNRATIYTENGCIFHTYVGYPDESCLESIYSIYRPDIVHVQGPIVYLAIPFLKRYRIPHLVGFHFWTGIMKPNNQGGFDNIDILDNAHQLTLDPLCQDQAIYQEFYVASEFINRVIRALGGQPIPNVIYPIPPGDHYMAPDGEKKYITIINISRGKGGDIFLEIVKAIKDLPFLAICNNPNVEMVGPDNLDEEIAREINGNVLPYTDVKEVYAKTRILLIPSHVDETFSRVAYEGAANGIPIITTGKGFIRQLLGDAGIYLGENPSKWIQLIRDIYHDEVFLAKYGRKLQKQVKNLRPQKGKFLVLVDRLDRFILKKNVMIFAPWCDQGLGHQAKLYSQLLRKEGFRVHIFSFLSYLCLDQLDKFQQDPTEWVDYDTIYESYNTREEVTERELRQFVLSRNIGICLIPGICFSPIFEKVKFLKSLNVRCYAIPNIETCRRDELDKYILFDKILCPTRQCYNVLKKFEVPNLEYIGHCLPIDLQDDVSKHLSLDKIKFLHVSGYNALTHKQTLLVLEAFRKAQERSSSNIELTVTFSKNVPKEVSEYSGDNITIITRPLSHKEIMRLYTQHHVSIQVPSHEGIGLGFYESIACQTPVISLDQAPHNEVIREGRSGWLLPSNEFDLTDNNQALVKGGLVSADDLADKIIYLDTHPEEIVKTTQACQEERKKWSRNLFIKRLVSIFDS